MKLCIHCQNTFESKEWVCPKCFNKPKYEKGYISFLDEEKEFDSYDQRFYPELFKLESNHFWFRHRSSLILWVIHNHYQAVRNVMEIGCGTGYMLSKINHGHPEYFLSGSDLYSEGLDFAKDRVPDASFYQMDVCNVPFRNEFDLILALDVLEHIEDEKR